VADIINNRSFRLGSLLPTLVLPASVAAINVSAITADSRTVRPGSVFFAVPGASHNGDAFIEDAVNAGAVAVICPDSQSAAEPTTSWRGDVPVLGVKDVPSTMGEVAALFYGEPSRSLAITGVTGTNGKSTCVFLLAQLQTLLGLKAGVVGTLGYGVIGESLQATGMTTPDVISSHRILRDFANEQVRSVAMEVSSHGLVQKRVAGIEITAGIFTNITRDHLDYHGDMAGYVRAKSQLFSMKSLRHAVINVDDENAGAMIAALQSGAQLWTYSLHDPSAEVYASGTNFSPEGVEAFVRTPWGSGKIHSPLLGEFNVYNSLAVLTAACAQGANFTAVLEHLPKLKPVKGRMERVAADSPVQVIVDYAHTPDALRQALTALRLHGHGKVHVVFGCGGDRDKGKRPQMAAAAEAGADDIIVTNDNPRTEDPERIIGDICNGFSHREKAKIILDRAEAIAYAIDTAAAGDMVLIAGKGHEDYQILGHERLNFDDAVQARLALQDRLTKEPC
jgi:UDP-N-acetylmuramoyl-L-alanyl-D-glutamate--2,6-diaminopimelate ligase